MSTYERGTSTRRGPVAAVVVALASVVLAAVPTPARAATAEVTMANLAFSPQNVTVERTEGEPELPDLHARVNFVNRDEGVEHTVLFNDRSVAVGSSGRLATGQVYTVIFEEPGVFPFQCEIHPSMTGTVTVTAGRSAADEGDDKDDEKDSSGTSVGIVLVVAGLAAVAVAAGGLLVRRQRRAAGADKPGGRPTRSGGS